MSGTKSDASTIASRQSRLMELLAEGRTQAESALVLMSEGYPAHPQTIWRDIKQLKVEWSANNSEAFTALRQSQLRILEKIEESLIKGSIDAETSRAWTGIRKEIGQLLGLNAPNRSVSAHVSVDADPSKLIGYRLFVRETQGLDSSQLEEVFAFARGLKRNLTVTANVPDRTDFDDDLLLEEENS